MDYIEFSEKVKGCQKCELSKTRTHVVVGEGNLSAEIILVGEAPGKEEDLSGRPFVGRSGKLLRKSLIDVGFDIKDIYITNIVKCRPPNNRDPKPEERNICGQYLLTQLLEFLKPKLVIGIGRISSQVIFKDLRMNDDHGRSVNLGPYHFIGIYHPAATMYNSELKSKFLQDIQNAADFMGVIKSDDKINKFF